MSLITEAINDAADFLENTDDFAAAIVLTSRDGQVANVTGISRKVGKKLEQSTGMVVNSKNATCTIHERTIATANPNYPVRSDESGEVDMIGHRVDVADSTGQIKNYVVLEAVPNETTGYIVFTLGDWRE